MGRRIAGFADRSQLLHLGNGCVQVPLFQGVDRRLVLGPIIHFAQLIEFSVVEVGRLILLRLECLQGCPAVMTSLGGRSIKRQSDHAIG